MLDPADGAPSAGLTEASWQERLQRALERTGLGTLRVHRGWALARALLEVPGGCERIVEATVRDKSPELPRRANEDDADRQEDDDEARALLVDYVVDCGIAIRVDEVVRAWPGCCADWGALHELRRALAAPDADECSIWIGHDGGALAIANTGPEALTLRTWHDERGEPEEWLVPRDVLEREIESAWDVVDRFEAVARPILDARLGGRTVRSRERS